MNNKHNSIDSNLLIKMENNIDVEQKEAISNIPSNAKKVFSGVLFDIYQWEQEIFDGTYKTFEMAKMLDGVQMVCVTKNKKLILLNEEQPGRKGPFLSLPGGGVDKGEKIIDAAKRELMEELGMQADEMICFMEKGLTSKLSHNSFYFIVKGCEKINEPRLDGGEKISSFEVDFDEFVEYTQKEDFRNKYFRDYIFRIVHTPGAKERFKKLLFE